VQGAAAAHGPEVLAGEGKSSKWWLFKKSAAKTFIDAEAVPVARL